MIRIYTFSTAVLHPQVSCEVRFYVSFQVFKNPIFLCAFTALPTLATIVTDTKHTPVELKICP